MFGVEFFIGEKGFYDVLKDFGGEIQPRMNKKSKNFYLTIVKCAFDCNVVHISVRHCCHLCFLNRWNTTFGVKDKDRNIGFVAQAVNCSTFHDYELT